MSVGTSGGTAGGKYILTFQMSGSGAQQLSQITSQLLSMANATTGGTTAIQGLINQVNALGLHALKTGTKILTLEAQLALAERGLNQLREAAQWMVSGGEAVIGGFMQLGRNVLEAVSPLENAANQMMIIGKMSRQSANDIIESVKGLVAATPFKTQELVDLNLALIMGKVSLDQWTDSTGKMMTLQSEASKGVSRLSGEILGLYGNTKITATSILADFAALTGNVGDRMPTFVRGIQRAFSTGNTRLLMDQVNAEALQALTGSQKLSKMEGTAEQAMKRLYEYLVKYNAVGMSALASDTATGIMSNFEEIPTLIYQAIGGDPSDPKSPYSQIKRAFAGFFFSIARVINDPKWKEGISKSLSPVIEVFARALRIAGDAAALLLNTLSKYPTLTSTVSILSVFGASVAIVSGGLIAAAAGASLFGLSIYGMHVAMTAALPVIRTFGVTLWTSLAPILVAGAKVLLVVAAIAAAYYGIKAFVMQFEPVKKFFEEMSLLFEAFWESMMNWTGDTSSIPKEMAERLEKAGLLDTFLNMNKGMYGAYLILRDIWHIMTGPVLEGVRLVAGAFGFQVNQTKEGQTELQMYFDLLKEGVLWGLTWVSRFAIAIAHINFLWVTMKTLFMLVAIPFMVFGHIILDTFRLIFEVISNGIMGIIQLLNRDFVGAAKSFYGAGKALVGYGETGNPLTGKWQIMKGMYSDQLGNMQQASDLADSAHEFANRPIEGITDRQLIEGMTITGNPNQPVKFDEATLLSLIQAGKADPGKVNKAIESGEIVVVANLLVDGEKMASTTVRHIKKNQSRNLGTIPGLTFG